MTSLRLSDLGADHLPGAARNVRDSGGRLHMAYAWAPAEDRLELRYLAEPAESDAFEVWRVDTAGKALPTLAREIPLLGWYEREMRDLFGIEFTGHPEPWPLALLEGARPAVAPLLPAATLDQRMNYQPEPWRLPDISQQDVQYLPFGPVRADVLESAQFVFFYLGETVLHYFPRLFFKHRGLEKRFEGLTPPLGAVLAERVSGVGSVAHALAYAQALEKAGGCVIPPRAAWLRSLLAELERLYNHLHYHGALADATTLKVGNAQGRWLEEALKQINARLTGSRLLRGLITPGGLRRDLQPAWVAEALNELRPDIQSYLERLADTASHRDRLMGNGALSLRVALDQGATGPIARASGLDADLRRDHPYAAYHSESVAVPLARRGDALGRFEVRSQEIYASLDLIARLLHSLPGGAVRSEYRAAPGSEGLGWAETPRGALFYALHVDDAGRLARVKIKSPSFSNWRVFPFTVHGADMMDYAINEASFGLTIAGCDR